MRPLFFIFLYTVLTAGQPCFSQSDSLKWWNPANTTFPVIEGRAWHTGLSGFYDRLPARAEKTVRADVWNLSKNTAGEYIRFTTDASEIIVRYTVAGSRSMNHMPATGVSGVDLYAQDVNNNWHWAKGSFSFGDTIVYKFSNMLAPAAIKEFRLYLPLYNIVTWMQIGTAAQKTFSPVAVSREPALVLYGTSIMQGGCASRPGLAWTNILGRKLNMTIINLGFSGNGRLEQPLIDLLNETGARLFVLDCQPNLVDKKVYSEEEIRQRITRSVKSLKEKHPQTPVLLAEHCCGLPAVSMDTSLVGRYKWTSDILSRTYAELKNEGVTNLHLLTATDIGFGEASTVDGTHPTDVGMMQYAEAYAKAIQKILGTGRSNKIQKKK